MRFLSLFSGIEAASVAWHPLGWECAAVAEIEPFPCAVLKHHYPNVPNLGDITKITQQQIRALGHIDVVVLGFPCQDASIAGLRKGLKHADGTLTRSGLFFTAMQVIEWTQARWIVGENVPGLFSVNKGWDFAAVVGELSGAELDVQGDGWRNAGVALGPKGLVEWFVLDAQYTRVASHPRAVPQRRRRVFFVRDSGDWQRRPPLFLIPESLRRNSPPRREAGKRPSPTLAARTRGGGGLGTDFDLDGGLTTVQCGEIVPQAMSSKWSKGSSGPAGDENGGGQLAVAFRVAGQDGFTPSNVSPPIAATDGGGAGAPAVAFQTRIARNGRGQPEEVCPTLNGSDAGETSDMRPCVLSRMAVRRLTPLECERLQGFPDNYTRIPVGKKGTPAKDGPRYKALGNSMAVNVMSWMGKRIVQVKDL